MRYFNFSELRIIFRCRELNFWSWERQLNRMSYFRKTETDSNSRRDVCRRRVLNPSVNWRADFCAEYEKTKNVDRIRWSTQVICICKECRDDNRTDDLIVWHTDSIMFDESHFSLIIIEITQVAERENNVPYKKYRSSAILSRRRLQLHLSQHVFRTIREYDIFFWGRGDGDIYFLSPNILKTENVQ